MRKGIRAYRPSLHRRRRMKAPGAAGETLYKTYCMGCHQAEGQGMPGMFPPLAKSDYLMADKTRVDRNSLERVEWSLQVNEENYNATMPPMGHLKDEEIADILSYVRSSWGNAGRSSLGGRRGCSAGEDVTLTGRSSMMISGLIGDGAVHDAVFLGLLSVSDRVLSMRPEILQRESAYTKNTAWPVTGHRERAMDRREKCSSRLLPTSRVRRAKRSLRRTSGR